MRRLPEPGNVVYGCDVGRRAHHRRAASSTDGAALRKALRPTSYLPHMEITSQQLDACIKAAIAENAVNVIDLLYEIKHGLGDAKPSPLHPEPPSPVQTSLPCDLGQGVNFPASIIDGKGYHRRQMNIAVGLIFKSMEVGTNFNYLRLAGILEADDLKNPWFDRTHTSEGRERWKEHLSSALIDWRVAGYIEQQTMRTHYKLVRRVPDFDLADAFPHR